jgi:hypothetical protein
MWSTFAVPAISFHVAVRAGAARRRSAARRTYLTRPPPIAFDLSADENDYERFLALGVLEPLAALVFLVPVLRVVALRAPVLRVVAFAGSEVHRFGSFPKLTGLFL